MGKMSIILVLAAVLTGGTVMYNIQRTTLDTDAKLSVQQLQFFAREAAFAGMEIEMREHIRLVTPLTTAPFSSGWVSVPDGNWHDYNGAAYAVTGDVTTRCPNVTAWDSLSTWYPNSVPINWMMDVTSVGRHGTGPDAVYHEVNACFVVMNAETTTPPWTEYAFISNDDFNFNGGISVDTISGLGNVHSNGDMDLGPNVRISGNVTYVGDGDVHNRTQTASFQEGEGITMTPFNPYADIPDPSVHRVDNTTPTLSGNVTVAPPGWTEGAEIQPGHLGSKENPFYWYIDGDLILDGTTHLRLPAHTIVVATGNMTVSGSASITVSAASAPESGSGEALTSWIEANLDDGQGMLGFYVNGGYYNSDGTVNTVLESDGVTLSGTGNIVGNIFTNANYTLNGGGQGSNMVGSVAAVGTITGNGGGAGNNTARNFWYAAISDEIIHPGLLIPANIVSMVSISEWKDPVIKNTGGPSL